MAMSHFQGIKRRVRVYDHELAIPLRRRLHARSHLLPLLPSGHSTLDHIGTILEPCWTS